LFLNNGYYQRAPDEIAFSATPTQPKCFGERIRSLSTPTGGTGTITFNATAATTNLDAGIILTPLLMRTDVLNQ
jgi:hypothetical protein